MMNKEVYVRVKESCNDIYVGLHCATNGIVNLIESVAFSLWKKENSKDAIKELDGFIARNLIVKDCFDKIIIILD